MLSELVAELGPVLARLATAYELILVNDGSPDASGQVAADLADQHSWIRAIDLLKNYGQHSALLCGIRAAAHPIVVTMDDDLQNPPEEIGALLRKLDEGFDVVYGWPRREQHGLGRAVLSRITKLALQRVLGAETARRVSGFRALRTQLRNAFADFQGPSVNLDVLLTWGTDRFSSVDVHHRSRRSGTSSYTSRKLIEHALNMLTGFTTVPLRAAVVLGFGAISEFPKWRKYLISLSFRDQSSVRPVQVGGFDVNIVIHRSTAVRGRGGPARHDAWPPSLGAILAHTDGPCGS